ncbi:hypothetical protein DL93DRAFT_1464391 [Clavulina sp. PMI_390]|nr:hypothetical protein DL93DRAFT_1464391 [Clavulina sp. PMI_390]
MTHAIGSHPLIIGSARTRDYELQLLSSRRRASSTTSQKSTAEEHRPSRTHTPQTITEERYSFSKRSLRNIGSAQPYPATHRPRLSITQAPASATSRAITTTDPIPSERMAPKPQPSIIGPYQPEPPQASQRGFSARVPVPAIHRKPIVKGEAVASTLALQARRGSLLQDNPLCPKVDGVSVNPTIFASLGAERRSAQADLMISRPMILQPQALVTQAQARIQKANLAPLTEIVPVRY